MLLMMVLMFYDLLRILPLHLSRCSFLDDE
jgi:hypothetical protein